MLGSPILPVVPRRCHACNTVLQLPWDASYYCTCGAHCDPRTGSAGEWTQMHQDDSDIRDVSALIGQIIHREWKLAAALEEVRR